MRCHADAASPHLIHCVGWGGSDVQKLEALTLHEALELGGRAQQHAPPLLHQAAPQVDVRLHVSSGALTRNKHGFPLGERHCFWPKTNRPVIGAAPRPAKSTWVNLRYVNGILAGIGNPAVASVLGRRPGLPRGRRLTSYEVNVSFDVSFILFTFRRAVTVAFR